MKKYTINHDSKKIESINNFINNGKFTIALREIVKYMEKYPTDDLGMLVYAECLYKMMSLNLGSTENHDEIEEVCFKLIYKESKFSDSAWNLLGMIKEDEFDYMAAETYFKNAVALGSEKSKPFLVSSLLKNQKSQEALDVIDTIGITDSFPEMTLLKKAMALHNLERNIEAQQIIDSIDICNFSDNQKRRYFIVKAKIYISIDKVAEAEKLMQECTKSFTGHHEEELILLRCYIKRRKIDEAYVLCNELIDNFSDEHREFAQCYLGRIYEIMGYAKKAEEMYLNLVSNDSSLKRKTKNIVYFNLGHLELCNKSYKNAEKWFLQMDDFEERSALKKKLYLAITYIKMGNFQKASELFDSIENGNYIEESVPLYHRVKSVILHSQKKHIDINCYFDQQLICYKKSLFFQHSVRSHQKEGKESIFRDNINLEVLAGDVETLIKSSPMIESNVIDKYLVYYKDIGYYGGIPTDYMEVVVIGGTNKMLTMYPVSHISEEKLQVASTDKVKKKQMPSSRIDKFYAKYGQKR